MRIDCTRSDVVAPLRSPMPTTKKEGGIGSLAPRGCTQCFAVSTTRSVINVPVHKPTTPWINTTAGSPVSRVPPEMGSDCEPTSAAQPARTRTLASAALRGEGRARARARMRPR